MGTDLPKDPCEVIRVGRFTDLRIRPQNKTRDLSPGEGKEAPDAPLARRFITGKPSRIRELETEPGGDERRIAVQPIP